MAVAVAATALVVSCRAAAQIDFAGLLSTLSVLTESQRRSRLAELDGTRIRTEMLVGALQPAIVNGARVVQVRLVPDEAMVGLSFAELRTESLGYLVFQVVEGDERAELAAGEAVSVEGTVVPAANAAAEGFFVMWLEDVSVRKR